MRAALPLLVGLVCLLPTSSGGADDASLPEQTARLQEQLGRLEAREDAKHVEPALEEARRSLRAASGFDGDPEAARRAQQIARAAMTLAERQLERGKAQTELLAAQRRLTSIRERAASQRRVLEVLMRERASLVDGAEQR
ncbi:MAG: hypothetical protein WCE62_07395 [Polyangiales bacterium]